MVTVLTAGVDSLILILAGGADNDISESLSITILANGADTAILILAISADNDISHWRR